MMLSCNAASLGSLSPVGAKLGGNGEGGSSGEGGAGAPVKAAKVDMLLMIDDSASMADKQAVLARSIPDFVARLATPWCGTTDAAGRFIPAPLPQPGADPNDPSKLLPCPAGTERQFAPVTDIHFGVVTSSLGGHGSDTCQFKPMAQTAQGNNPTLDEHAHLVRRSPRTDATDFSFGGPPLATPGGDGFLAWDPTQKGSPVGATDAAALTSTFTAMILGVDQAGCGYEAQLEAFYRFLIDPSPPAAIHHERGASGKVIFNAPVTADGIDTTLLQQRADFVRPDSMIAVVLLSDENDGSLIDGTLPGTVCNTPTLDAAGRPTGCAGPASPWPASYGTMNQNDGHPFEANWLYAQLDFPENVPYVLPSGIAYFHAVPGSSACDVDWASPECKTCYSNDVATTDPKCVAAFSAVTPIPDDDDPILLRMWDMRRRFGVDALYPLQRYVDGLTSAKVYDRNGYLVTNPLFDDLPYAAALAKGAPLARAKAPPRSPSLVFFEAIIGVPWQDIARDPNDPSRGYKPTVGVDPADPGLTSPIAGIGPAGGVTGWDLILGDPFNPVAASRHAPFDPLMIESNRPRFGQGKPALTHPITGESLGDNWNSINGNDYVAAKLSNPGSTAQDLEYACVFPLPRTLPPVDCKAMAEKQLPCDCANWSPGTKNPLCATPVDPDHRAVGQWGTFETNQYRAKAYPGTRYLEVMRSLGAQAVVASICATNTDDPTVADYGYRPAADSLFTAIAPHLP